MNNSEKAKNNFFFYEISPVYKTGSLHNMYNIGYQDSFIIKKNNEIAVCLITDGCTSSNNGFSKNQMGAILGGDFLCDFFFYRLLKYEDIDLKEFKVLLDKASKEITKFFQRLLRSYVKATASPYQSALKEITLKNLLFSIIGIVFYHNQYFIFGFGDCLYGKGSHALNLNNNGTGNYLLSKLGAVYRDKPENMIQLGNNFLKDGNQQVISKNNTEKSISSKTKFPKKEPLSSVLQELEILDHGKLTHNDIYWIASDGIKRLLIDINSANDFHDFIYNDRTFKTNDNNTFLTAIPFNKLLGSYKFSCNDDVTLILCRASQRRGHD